MGVGSVVTGAPEPRGQPSGSVGGMRGPVF